MTIFKALICLHFRITIKGFIDIKRNCLIYKRESPPGGYYSRMKIRAIRGATQLSVDSASEMTEAVTELLTQLFTKNNIGNQDLVSILFTATPDLKSEFPAAAARNLDLGGVPLICASELDVSGALARVVRVMVHAYSESERAEIKHIYLRGAVVLRPDLAK